jgi:hypothetical protein
MTLPSQAQFLNEQIHLIASTLPPGPAEDRAAAAQAALADIGPQDLMETMLAARMIAAHHAAMDAFARAMQPDLSDVEVVRLRSSAIAAGRSADAAQRTLDKRRAPAAAPARNNPRTQATADRPARSQSQSLSFEDCPHSGPQLADFTPEEVAAAEYELDNDPAELARAELAARVPLYRWEDMSMEQRRIAYAKPAPLTPAKIAVLGARLAAANGSKPPSGTA